MFAGIPLIRKYKEFVAANPDRFKDLDTQWNDVHTKRNAAKKQLEELKTKRTLIDEQIRASNAEEEKNAKELELIVKETNAKITEKKKIWNHMIKSLVRLETQYTRKAQQYLVDEIAKFAQMLETQQKAYEKQQEDLKRESEELHQKLEDQYEKEIVELLDQFKLYVLQEV